MSKPLSHIWTSLPLVACNATTEGACNIVGAVDWCDGSERDHPSVEGFFFYLGINPKPGACPGEVKEFHALDLERAEIFLSTMLSAVRAARKVKPDVPVLVP